MNMLDKKDAEKMTAGLKASKSATKAKAKKDIKAAAEKVLVEIGANLSGAGEAKKMVQATMAIDKLEEQRKAINLAIRGQRAVLKEMKIPMAPYDQARKMRKMDPEDVRSFKASQALIEQTLSMELSSDQKSMIDDIEKQRESSKAALMEANGGDTGKEIGSGAAKATPNVTAPLPTLPQRNESLTPGMAH